MAGKRYQYKVEDLVNDIQGNPDELERKRLEFNKEHGLLKKITQN
jgi:hypothetical protein